MRKKNWIEFDNRQNLNERKRETPISTNHSKIKIYTQKKGKKGKTITLIEGLKFQEDQKYKKLLRDLKIFCGTGGAINGEEICLQGSLVEKVKEFLRKDGYLL